MVKNAIEGDRRADFDRAREDIAGLYRLESDVGGRDRLRPDVRST